MYRTIEDFTKDWAYESEATTKILAALTDASLQQRVTPDGRTLGFMAWHIVVCIGMAAEAGLPAFQDAAAHDSQPPSSAAAITDAYRKSAAGMAASVQQHWRDANLLEEVPMYGQTWTRGYALFAMVKHQAHHRGQMTVLMRQAGLPVPGAYGPAKEEWAAMGMEAQP
jgi:uncharacterized damage-inducible protein DinB